MTPACCTAGGSLRRSDEPRAGQTAAVHTGRALLDRDRHARRDAGERAAIATLVAPDGVGPDTPRGQPSSRFTTTGNARSTGWSAVRPRTRTTELSTRHGPDPHSPTTGPEALDLELTHLGRCVRTYGTHADPTHSGELLRLLLDAVRRTAGQDAEVGDFELVVRHAGGRGVVTTVVAPHGPMARYVCGARVGRRALPFGGWGREHESRSTVRAPRTVRGLAARDHTAPYPPNRVPCSTSVNDTQPSASAEERVGGGVVSRRRAQRKPSHDR
jgi:hypothetical protein